MWNMRDFLLAWLFIFAISTGWIDFPHFMMFFLLHVHMVVITRVRSGRTECMKWIWNCECFVAVNSYLLKWQRVEAFVTQLQQSGELHISLTAWCDSYKCWCSLPSSSTSVLLCYFFRCCWFRGWYFQHFDLGFIEVMGPGCFPIYFYCPQWWCQISMCENSCSTGSHCLLVHWTACLRTQIYGFVPFHSVDDSGLDYVLSYRQRQSFTEIKWKQCLIEVCWFFYSFKSSLGHIIRTDMIKKNNQETYAVRFNGRALLASVVCGLFVLNIMLYLISLGRSSELRRKKKLLPTSFW